MKWIDGLKEFNKNKKYKNYVVTFVVIIIGLNLLVFTI